MSIEVGSHYWLCQPWQAEEVTVIAKDSDWDGRIVYIVETANGDIFPVFDDELSERASTFR